MNKASRLHNALKSWMGQDAHWRHLSHLTTCILLVVALIQTGSVSLTKWTVYLPNRGTKQRAQSKQRRISRWLHNPRINVHRLYKPLIKAALSNWTEDVIYLAIDTSLFWDEYCLIRLSVIHRGRAIPLTWRVFEHPSASVSFRDYQSIIQRAVGCLPSGVKVVLLADRGFVHTDLMKMLTTQLGWSYRIRLKSNSWIWRGGKGWCQLKDYHLNLGQAICLHNLRLHKGAYYGVVHVIIGRNNVNGEFWAIVSDEPTSLKNFEEYGLRFDIEENFLDDQSNGWNIQKSELRNVCALSRLWFILAVATLYVTAQGVEVVESGNRRRVDPHWFRGNSYFRIGWDWIKVALINGWQLLKTAILKSNQDPEPAMASQKQHEARLYRLEFQVQKFLYDTV